MTNNIKVQSNASNEEKASRNNLVDLMNSSPIPNDELILNTGLYLNRQNLSRILFMNKLYKKIVGIHGSIMEFGVRWGQNLSLFTMMRGIYEPYNYNRKIIGFDTFQGFPNVVKQDGDYCKNGDYKVTDNYKDDHLIPLLDYHESNNPIPHLKKHEIVEGDATINILTYLEQHPETIIAFAYFDFDIYAPTKSCLGAIIDRMPKKAILAFDELNCEKFPGETIAFHEVVGINNYKLKRSPLCPLCSYIEL